jgi:hypothetical protein
MSRCAVPLNRAARRRASKTEKRTAAIPQLTSEVIYAVLVGAARDSMDDFLTLVQTVIAAAGGEMTFKRQSAPTTLEPGSSPASADSEGSNDGR